jgi:A/G-specific adenine glycosylase
VPAFASLLIAWQRRHGRKGLPWQDTRDPYRIWLSEVMLQQTQVAAVIPYYQRFVSRFPDVQALAAADEDEVLRLWSGLGYYARARNLHRAARKIVSERGGRFPDSVDEIEQVPGIGRSTAAAIASFAFGRRAAILDGNVKRVLARSYGIEGWPGEREVEAKLWRLAERLLPKDDVGVYTQALMDLGATVCIRQPRCDVCPVRRRCMARRENRAHELPAPRPRRAVPLRDATWLLLLHNQQVLLERRPGAGLWGGLWSFPVASKAGYAAQARELGCEISSTRELEPLEHGFTHFRLRIRPVLCGVARTLPGAAAPGRLWIDLEDAAQAAVPVPVKKLVARLGASTASW